MPRLAITVSLLILIGLVAISAYAGYLVIGMLAEYLGSGRFVAGLLLGLLFLRLPRARDGKLHTVGLLPKKARLPVMAGLLAFCLVSYFQRGEMVPVLFLGLAATFLFTFRWIKQLLANRVLSIFSRSPAGPAASPATDQSVIDVEFREKND